MVLEGVVGYRDSPGVTARVGVCRGQYFVVANRPVAYINANREESPNFPRISTPQSPALVAPTSLDCVQLTSYQ